MRAQKRDANEKALLSLALSMGAVFYRYPPLDGLLGYRGEWIPVEIKNPHGRNQYTRIQEAFIACCERNGLKYFTWRTEEDVLRDLGAKRAA